MVLAGLQITDLRAVVTSNGLFESYGASILIPAFLAWSDALPDEGAPEIHLIHCVRNKEEVVGLDRLTKNDARVQNFHLHIYESDTHGRFGPEKLKEMVPFELGSASFWFCGPAPMRTGLIKGLTGIGAKPRSVHFERFEFR